MVGDEVTAPQSPLLAKLAYARKSRESVNHKSGEDNRFALSLSAQAQALGKGDKRKN